MKEDNEPKASLGVRWRIAMAWLYDKPLWKQLLRLSAPAVLEQMLILLVSIIATAMIGHTTTAALGAVGVVNMTVQSIQAFMCILSVGVTVIVARLIGAGDNAGARDAARQALLGGAAIAIVLPLLLWIFSEPILRAFMSRVEPDVFDSGLRYFRSLLPGLPMFIMNLVISGMMRGSGDMRHPMVTALLVNVLSVLIGYPLIFGLGPIPALGITGAGVSMSIARTVGGLLMLTVLIRGKSRIHVPLRGMLRLRWGMMRRILRVGVPASIEQVALVGGNLMVQVVIALLSTNEMATYQVLSAVGGITFQVISGIGMASTTLTGQYLGSKEPEKAHRVAWQSTALGTVLTNIIFGTLCLLAAPVALIFTRDPHVVALAVELMPVLAVSQFLICAVNVIPAALRGGGDIMFVTWTNIATAVFRVGGTYALTQYAGMGIEALYYTMFIDFLLRSASYVWRLEKGPWKTKAV